MFDMKTLIMYGHATGELVAPGLRRSFNGNYMVSALETDEEESFFSIIKLNEMKEVLRMDGCYMTYNVDEGRSTGTILVEGEAGEELELNFAAITKWSSREV